MPWTLKVYDSRAQAAEALAESVADSLRAALEARGRAALAVPGGTTPEPFLHALAQQCLDWLRVDVLPSDERWVPEVHPRANAGLIRRSLLSGRAGQARLLPLYAEGETPERGVEKVEARLRAQLGVPPVLDVAVLGMGEDMHVASLFPGAQGLAAALDPDGDRNIAAIRAAGAGEPRVTLTLPFLARARGLHVLIFGEKKRAVLERAAKTAPQDSPIRAVADAAQSSPCVHWAP